LRTLSNETFEKLSKRFRNQELTLSFFYSRRTMQQRRLPSAEALAAIILGQQQRTVLVATNSQYVSKCRVCTKILNEMEEEIRQEALELDENGAAISHLGLATGVLRLKLPISVLTATRLFAAISVDESLPKQKRARREEEEVFEEDLDELEAQQNPGKDMQTVTAQTYQNYKSALKWWHEHHDHAGKQKDGVTWPAEVDREVNAQIKSYKRDVRQKKRRRVMTQKEGKSAFKLTYYAELSLGVAVLGRDTVATIKIDTPNNSVTSTTIIIVF
jgi:hypothetical protein